MLDGGTGTKSSLATTRLSSTGVVSDHRILLFVAPPGTVSEPMSAAIEREFGWISVRHVSRIDLACQAFDAEIQIVSQDVV